MYHHYDLGHNTDTLIISLAAMAYGLWGMVVDHFKVRTGAFRRREEYSGAGARVLGFFFFAIGASLFWYFFIHMPAPPQALAGAAGK